jgi:hypothetical protein
MLYGRSALAKSDVLEECDLGGVLVALPVFGVGKPRPIPGKAQETPRFLGIPLQLCLPDGLGRPFPEI